MRDAVATSAEGLAFAGFLLARGVVRGLWTVAHRPT